MLSEKNPVHGTTRVLPTCKIYSLRRRTLSTSSPARPRMATCLLLVMWSYVRPLRYQAIERVCAMHGHDCILKMPSKFYCVLPKASRQPILSLHVPSQIAGRVLCT